MCHTKYYYAITMNTFNNKLKSGEWNHHNKVAHNGSLFLVLVSSNMIQIRVEFLLDNLRVWMSNILVHSSCWLQTSILRL